MRADMSPRTQRRLAWLAWLAVQMILVGVAGLQWLPCDDLAGIRGERKFFDACGVCGGDGSECAGSTLRYSVNFQPASIDVPRQVAAVPSDYLVDSGGVFADHGTDHTVAYGWSESVTALVSHTSDAEADIFDARYLSSVGMTSGATRYTWEIAVGVGTYDVSIMMGSDAHVGLNHIVVEGVLHEDMDGPDAFDHFANIRVRVTDGRLTLRSHINAVSPRLCWVNVALLGDDAPPAHERIGVSGVEVGESGRATMVDGGTAIVFQRTYSRPVVFCSPLYATDALAKVCRVVSVTPTGATIATKVVDGSVADEVAFWWVLEEGEWEVGGQAWVVGRANTRATVGNRLDYGGEFAVQRLPPDTVLFTGTQPALFSQAQVHFVNAYTTTRQRHVAGGGFEFAHELAEDNTGTAGFIDIGWLVMAYGEFQWFSETGYVLAEDEVTHAGTARTETETDPRFIANVATWRDRDNVVVRATAGGAQNDNTFLLREDTEEDSEGVHAAERVNIFWVTDGSGFGTSQRVTADGTARVRNRHFSVRGGNGQQVYRAAAWEDVSNIGSPRYDVVDGEGVRFPSDPYVFARRCIRYVATNTFSTSQAAQVLVLQDVGVRPQFWVFAHSKAVEVSGAAAAGDYGLHVTLTYDNDATELFTGAFDTGTHDWQRVIVPVVPTGNVRHVEVKLRFASKEGTVYFDDVGVSTDHQLTLFDDTVAGLLTDDVDGDNVHFDTLGSGDTPATSWRAEGDGYDVWEKGGFALAGSGNTRHVVMTHADFARFSVAAQHTEFTTPQSFSLVVSAWSKAVGVVLSDSAVYALEVVLVHSDEDRRVHTVSFDDGGTNEWAHRQLVVPFLKPVSYMSVSLSFRGAVGRVHWDDVHVQQVDATYGVLEAGEPLTGQSVASGAYAYYVIQPMHVEQYMRIAVTTDDNVVLVARKNALPDYGGSQYDAVATGMSPYVLDIAPADLTTDTWYIGVLGANDAVVTDAHLKVGPSSFGIHALLDLHAPTFPAAKRAYHSFNLQGSAYFEAGASSDATYPTAYRLTSAAANETGSMWFPLRVPVSTGFETTFTFRVSGFSTCNANYDGVCGGGDGFAFVVQSEGPRVLGNGGDALGYGCGNDACDDGITHSLAVEFDTWGNRARNDPSAGRVASWASAWLPTSNAQHDNHIGIMTRRDAANSQNHGHALASTTLSGHFADGAFHTVRIKYVPGRLSVFLDDTTGSMPVLVAEHRMDAGKELDDDGMAYIGFTAATGVAYQAHDIAGWSICSNVGCTAV